jgi:hypothetical protein
MKRFICLALLCASTSLVAQNPSPWNGTWKLDRSRSHLTGTTYTQTKGAHGMWVSTAGPLTFTYATDGKPYPMLDPDPHLDRNHAGPTHLQDHRPIQG